MMVICTVALGFSKISIQSKASFKDLNTIHVKVVVPFRRSAKYTAMNIIDFYTVTAERCCLDWRGVL